MVIDRIWYADTETTKSRIISDIVITITIFITIAAMWYILRKMNAVKPQIIYERRKARWVLYFMCCLYIHSCSGTAKLNFYGLKTPRIQMKGSQALLMSSILLPLIQTYRSQLAIRQTVTTSNGIGMEKQSVMLLILASSTHPSHCTPMLRFFRQSPLVISKKVGIWRTNPVDKITQLRLAGTRAARILLSKSLHRVWRILIRTHTRFSKRQHNRTSLMGPSQRL